MWCVCGVVCGFFGLNVILFSVTWGCCWACCDFVLRCKRGEDVGTMLGGVVLCCNWVLL